MTTTGALGKEAVSQRWQFSMLVAALALVLAPSALGQTPARPPELERAIAARERLRTARIVYLLTDVLDGRLETRVYTLRYGGGAIELVDHGDEFGVVARDESGRKAESDFNTANHLLSRDGELWEYNEGDTMVALYDAAKRPRGGVIDARFLGPPSREKLSRYEAYAAEQGGGGCDVVGHTGGRPGAGEPELQEGRVRVAAGSGSRLVGSEALNEDR